MAEEKKEKSCKSEDISLQELKLAGKLNKKYYESLLKSEVNKSCEDEAKIKSEALKNYSESSIMFNPYIEPDKQYLEELNRVRKTNLIEPEISGTFFSFYIKNVPSIEAPLLNSDKMIDSFVNSLVCLGLKSRDDAAQLIKLFKKDKKKLKPYYNQHLISKHITIPDDIREIPIPDDIREKKYPFGTADEVKNFFALLSRGDGLMDNFYMLVMLNNKKSVPVIVVSLPGPFSLPPSPPVHEQRETETFIIYKKNNKLWYIDTLKQKNEKIDIQSPTQPWSSVKPKTTLTVLVRSDKRIYVNDAKDEEKEETFKKTYNTSYIRNFTKDQLFEVDAYSNLSQRILIKNLKTDIYRLKKGTKDIYDKIEGPYMLHIYNLTLDGIERKFYLFGEMHQNPSGHCLIGAGVGAKSQRFHIAIQKLMEESPAFFDLFVEWGITKETGQPGGQFFSWNVYSFVNEVVHSLAPTIEDKINDAYKKSLIPKGTGLEPELLEISNSINMCFDNNKKKECKLFRAHYIDNRTIFNRDKYNILIYWLFSLKNSINMGIPTFELIFELKFTEFVFSLFTETIDSVMGSASASYFTASTNTLFSPGGNFTRLNPGDWIIVETNKKYKGQVSSIVNNEQMILQSLDTFDGNPSRDILPGSIDNIDLVTLGSITGEKIYDSIMYNNHNNLKALFKSALSVQIKNFFVREFDSYVASNSASVIQNHLFNFYNYTRQFYLATKGIGSYPSIVPGDPVDQAVNFVSFFLNMLCVADMDIYLLSRLFQDRTQKPDQPEKCYTSITYSGSLHTENYNKFFNYLITTGGFTGSKQGDYINPIITNGCLNLSGIQRTDSDLF